MKTIELRSGAVALVDDGDYGYLISGRWYEQKTATGRSYAIGYLRDAATGINHWDMMQNHIMKPEDGLVVDHKDNDGLNNQRSNLRICTKSQNLHNRTRVRKPKHGYYGITPVKGKWRAQVCIQGRNRQIGTFSTKEDAAQAYNQAIIDAGLAEFAPLNVITEEA